MELNQLGEVLKPLAEKLPLKKFSCFIEDCYMVEEGFAVFSTSIGLMKDLEELSINFGEGYDCYGTTLSYFYRCLSKLKHLKRIRISHRDIHICPVFWVLAMDYVADMTHQLEALELIFKRIEVFENTILEVYCDTIEKLTHLKVLKIILDGNVQFKEVTLQRFVKIIRGLPELKDIQFNYGQLETPLSKETREMLAVSGKNYLKHRSETL